MEPSRRWGWGLGVVVLVGLVALAPPARAAQQVLFGPQVFTLTSSSPQTVSTFVSALPGVAHLHLVNGLPDGSARLAQASLLLNGLEVVGPQALGPHVAVVDVPVTLTATTLLTVTLTGPVGGTLTLTLERRDAALVSVTPNAGRQGRPSPWRSSGATPPSRKAALSSLPAPG